MDFDTDKTDIIKEVVAIPELPVATSALEPLVEYASKLQKEYEGSGARAEMIKLAKEARKEYEGFRNEKKIPWEGSANYSMMIMTIIVDDVECKIATLLTGKGQDIVRVETGDPQLEERKEHIEGFIEAMLDRNVKWHKFIPTAVHDVLLDGTVFVLPRYEEKTVKRGERIVGMFPINPVTQQRIGSEEELRFLEMSGITPVKALIDEIAFKDQRVFRVVNEIININDVYGPDTIREWGDGHPLIIRRRYSLGELKKLSDGNGPYINITPDLAGEETNTADADAISLDAENWKLTAEQERKQIECFECWLPDASLNEGDEPDWAIITYTATNKTLIRKQYMRDVFYDNEFPIKRLGLSDDNKHFYCTPLYQKVRHHHKAINDRVNQNIDTGTIVNSPVFFYDQVQSGINRDEVEWYPGAMNPCTNPQAIQQMQVAPGGMPVQEIVNLILGFVERLVGVTSYTEGTQDQAMANGAGTSSGMRMLLNESQTKRNYQNKSMRESLEELILTDLRLYAWYMPYDEQVNIGGQMQPADIQALQGDYTISIQISDSACNDMLARLESVELFQLASSLPFANQIELFKDVLQSYQKRNPEGYINPAFMFVLQAVAQNPQVAQVVQQFMAEQAEAAKQQAMEQKVADSMRQKFILDQAQAAAVEANNPAGLPLEKIAKAFDSIQNSQARDWVEAQTNAGVRTGVMNTNG